MKVLIYTITRIEEPIQIEQCEGFWRCLEPSDWIQLAATIFAVIAAVASAFAVGYAREQIKEERKDRKRRYLPIFKIKEVNRIANGMVVEVDCFKQEYFEIKSIEWISDSQKDEIKITNKDYKLSTTKLANADGSFIYDSITIYLNIPENIDDHGYIRIEVYDINRSLSVFKTRNYEVSYGKFKNDYAIGDILKIEAIK